MMTSYQEYIKSKQWLSRHRDWLKLSKNRCQLFPWVRVGSVNGKYYSYNIHHLHLKAYQRQGKEAWNRDVVVLCPFAHQLVFHCLLSGGKRRVSHQKDFPNLAQRGCNWLCRINGILINQPAPVWVAIVFASILIAQYVRVSAS